MLATVKSRTLSDWHTIPDEIQTSRSAVITVASTLVVPLLSSCVAEGAQSRRGYLQPVPKIVKQVSLHEIGPKTVMCTERRSLPLDRWSLE